MLTGFASVTRDRLLSGGAAVYSAAEQWPEHSIAGECGVDCVTQDAQHGSTQVTSPSSENPIVRLVCSPVGSGAHTDQHVNQGRVWATVSLAALLIAGTVGCDGLGCAIPCNDGTCSPATNRQGACSHHGGIAESPTSNSNPFEPTPIPPSESPARIDYQLRVVGIDGRPGWYRAVLDLAWVAGDVGYTIESVRVEMRDDGLRTVFLQERSGAAVASTLGTVRVERLSTVRVSFEAEFTAGSSYVGATVISVLLDDRGGRRTLQLSVARNPVAN